MRRARVMQFVLRLSPPLVILAAVLLSGVDAAQADRTPQWYRNAHTSHVIRDRSINPKLSPASRARALKAAAAKQKEEARNFITRTAKEEAAASVASGKEGAK